MKDYLQSIYWNNKVIDYLYVAGAIILAWIVLQIIKRTVIATLRRLTGRSKTQFDDILIGGFATYVVPYIYILINFAIINQLKLTAGVNKAIEIGIAIVTVFYGAKFINNALQVSLNLYLDRRGEGPSRMMQMNGILNIFKVVVWAIGLLFLLDNLGYEVTTIITGLGIGGIAIALAAQNILSDLFSYFVIFFDKPFEIGDYVVAGDKSGTVEQIGIKTSRIRTLGGEELVMPNAELVKTPIHNFKRQEKRRVVFNVRVDYKTPAKFLKELPSIIKEIVSTKSNVTFDRAHLQALGDYYINYEIVYIILSADYTLYMDSHQSICLELIEVFRNKGIDFAIPVQIVRVNSNDSGAKDNSDEPKSEFIVA